jgi:hypothetical protein
MSKATINNIKNNWQNSRKYFHHMPQKKTNIIYLKSSYKLKDKQKPARKIEESHEETIFKRKNGS